MGSFAKYPEIELLHKVPAILDELEVVVLEKIHGRNARLGWVGGLFRIGSRTEEFDLELSTPSTGREFFGWVMATNLKQRIKELAESISSDVIFYGEWFGPGVQKGVVYADEKQLRIFDVRINDDLVDWDKVVELVERVGLKTVPLLYRGKPTMDILDEKRIIPSAVAYENTIGSEQNVGEGVVVKPTRMHRNSYGNWIMAKYKSPKFSEQKSLSEVRVQPVIPESATTFIEEFFTLQRLDHVIDSLRSIGIDVTVPATTGQIIRGMYEDVLKESETEYAQLDDDARRTVDKRHSGKTKTLLSIWLANQAVSV